MTRYFRTILAICLAVILSACSLQKMYDSVIPDSVRAQSEAVVDEMMAGDMSSLREAFAESSGDGFEAMLADMAAEVRSGEEIAREIVNVQSSVRASTTDGKSATYSVGHEVETDAGFTRIYQTWSDTGDGPMLSAVNIEGADESMAAQLRRAGTIARIVGGVLLLGLLALGLMLLRRRKRRVAGV